jgi:hypothetical protein
MYTQPGTILFCPYSDIVINWNSSQAASSLRVDPDRVMDVTSDPLPALHMNYLIHKDCIETETFSNNEPAVAYL